MYKYINEKLENLNLNPTGTKLHKAFEISLLGNDEWSEDQDLSDYYNLVAKGLIMRNLSSMPKSLPNRIAVVTVMLVCAFIFWIWEAGMISYVSVRKTTLPIETFEDLLKRSNLKVHISNLFQTYVMN